MISQSTSVWRSADHRNHANVLGQQSHRKTIYQPIHQLVNNLRPCVMMFRTKVINTKLVSMFITSVATNAVACLSCVSSTAIMSSRCIIALQSPCFVQVSGTLCTTNFLSLIAFWIPRVGVFQCRTFPHPRCCEIQSQQSYRSTVASRSCDPYHGQELQASIVEYHEPCLWILLHRTGGRSGYGSYLKSTV